MLDDAPSLALDKSEMRSTGWRSDRIFEGLMVGCV
jgi:hypothetical protein